MKDVTYRRVNENMVSAKLALRQAKQNMQTALNNLELTDTVTRTFINDLIHTTTQLIDHSSLWTTTIENKQELKE